MRQESRLCSQSVLIHVLEFSLKFRSAERGVGQASCVFRCMCMNTSANKKHRTPGWQHEQRFFVFFASKHHKLGSWQACSAFQTATTVSTWISLFISIFFSCWHLVQSSTGKKTKNKKLYWPRAHEAKVQIVLKRDSAVKLKVVNSRLLTYQKTGGRVISAVFTVGVSSSHALFTCTL